MHVPRDVRGVRTVEDLCEGLEFLEQERSLVGPEPCSDSIIAGPGAGAVSPACPKAHRFDEIRAGPGAHSVQTTVCFICNMSRPSLYHYVEETTVCFIPKRLRLSLTFWITSRFLSKGSGVRSFGGSQPEIVSA
jgi:hypothetical protein